LIDKKKRKEMEDLIYKVFDALDDTGTNTNKYQELFSTMNDTQFDTFFKKLFKDEDLYLTLDVVDYERNLNMEKIEKAAKVINVPLYERVVIPFSNMDKDNPVVSKYEVPVGYTHLKRMQQMVFKKNSTSTDISLRSSTTGQVTADDKNAKETDNENFALMSLGVEYGMKEFMSARSDDLTAKNEMYSEIAKKGYVSLAELTDHVDNKVTLNTLDVYLIGCGIKSDIITDGFILRKTLKEKKRD
jgi:hypothetical protein